MENYQMSRFWRWVGNTSQLAGILTVIYGIYEKDITQTAGGLALFYCGRNLRCIGTESDLATEMSRVGDGLSRIAGRLSPEEICQKEEKVLTQEGGEERDMD